MSGERRTREQWAAGAGIAQQAAARRHDPQPLGQRRRALAAEVGDGRRAGLRQLVGQLAPRLRHGRDPRRRPPAGGRAQLGGVRAGVVGGELAEAPIGAAGVDRAFEHVVCAAVMLRGPQLEPGESARRRSARSVSRERRVIGYGGIFHGCQPSVP